jgi:hypothetical protein
MKSIGVASPSRSSIERRASIRLAALAIAAIVGCSDQDEMPVDPGDTTPPSSIQDLHPISVSDSSATLQWTAPGNDGALGTASIYDLRYSESPIDEGNWSAAGGAADEPAPAVGGSVEVHIVPGLSDSTTYYFALRTFDGAGNASELSNLATATTRLTPNPYEEADYAVLAGLLRDAFGSVRPLLPALGDFVAREPGENFIAPSGPSSAPGAPAGARAPNAGAATQGSPGEASDLALSPRGECPFFEWVVEARQAALTVDYGDGCVAPDSVFRSGSYVVSGEYRHSTGLDLSVLFEQYLVDDGSEPFEVGGTYEIVGTRQSLAIDIDGTITRRIFSSSAVVASITMDVQSGQGAWDTVFMIGGTGSVTTDAAVVSLSLVEVDWPADCYLPIAGHATLRIPMEYLDELGLPGSDDLTVEFDFAAPSYGAPECDDIALVTIGRYSAELPIRD